MNYLYNNLSLLLRIVAVVTFTSCNPSPKANNSYYSCLELQDTLYHITNDTLAPTPISQLIDKAKSYTVLTFITGDCGGCLSKIQAWEELNENTFDGALNLLVFIETKNITYFQTMLYPDFKVNIPLYYDLKEKITCKHDLYERNTFLLDSHMNVLVEGDPMLSKKVLGNYKRIVL